MAKSRKKLVEYTDSSNCKVIVTENIASEWQKQLNVKISGQMLDPPSFYKPGATSNGSFPIKSPDELHDFVEQLQSFIETPSMQELKIKIGPHKRNAGILARQRDTIIWDRLGKTYGQAQAVIIQQDSLEILRDAIADYQ